MHAAGQELMALPRMTPQRLETFRAEVAKRHTEKVQRSMVRKLLQSTGAHAPSDLGQSSGWCA